MRDGRDRSTTEASELTPCRAGEAIVSLIHEAKRFHYQEGNNNRLTR
jgi:hypothetical protein